MVGRHPQKDRRQVFDKLGSMVGRLNNVGYIIPASLSRKNPSLRRILKPDDGSDSSYPMRRGPPFVARFPITSPPRNQPVHLTTRESVTLYRADKASTESGYSMGSNSERPRVLGFHLRTMARFTGSVLFYLVADRQHNKRRLDEQEQGRRPWLTHFKGYRKNWRGSEPNLDSLANGSLETRAK